MAHHHLEARPGTVRWGHWDALVPPALTVRSGDTVTLDTLSGGPQDLPDPSLGFTIVDGHRDVHAAGDRGPGPHFLTGPVAVEGAAPGDVLEVRIKEVSLRQDWGWMLQAPLLGTLPDDFPDWYRLHLPVDRNRGRVTLPWGQELETAPFFGCMGVAPPPAWGRQSSKEPRAFGGNMDNKELGAGATVYFPVFVPGGNFSAGDGHAVQGDGEVCVTAVETGLTGTFELILRKGMPLALPRAERADAWITMAFHEDLDEAVRIALREMIALIGTLSGLTPQEAYALCSLAADLRVTQSVNGNKGIHCVIDKAKLPRR